MIYLDLGYIKDEFMNEITADLLALNKKIVETLTAISQFKPRFYHAIATYKTELYEFETILSSYRSSLAALDDRISSHIRIPGDYNSIQMHAGKLSIVFSTRNIALTTLDEAQKLLSAHNSQASFKLSTLVSLAAIVISVVGSILG
jgi:hypothetical protein